MDIEAPLRVLGQYLAQLRSRKVRSAAENDGGILPIVFRDKQPLERPDGSLRRWAHQTETLDRWEERQLAQWAKAGRLAEGGALKTNPDAQEQRWTFQRIKSIWPEIAYWDAIAVLIWYDGTLEGLTMEAKENVLAVIEEAVDLKVARIFGEVLMAIRRGGDGVVAMKARPGKKLNRCSKCKQPGHRATTCTAAAKE